MNLEEYLGKTSKKHLVFDFDLTLVELFIEWQIVKEKIHKYFAALDPVLAAECEDLGYAGYNKMIKKYGPEVKKTVDELYLEAETDKNREVTLNKEALNFIAVNQNKYTFYIWSNNQRQTVDEILKENNLTKYFKTVVTASDVKLFKPDIKGFYRIYIKGQNKKEYLMIGDSDNDRKSAENSGIDYFYLRI